MTAEIAVVVDAGGQIASLFEAERIVLYSKEKGIWMMREERPFRIALEKGVKALRESLTQAITNLGDIKVIAGREITGLAYNIFDTAGFHIFEVEGSPQEFLEFISETIEENRVSLLRQREEEQAAAYPVKTGTEGKYYLDLKDLQLRCPEITSKKVLLPFLKTESFYELEVVCSHVPPWFERDFTQLGLEFDVVKSGQSECLIKIYHKTCGEAWKNSGGM